MNHTQLQQCCINEISVANVTVRTYDSFCISIKNEHLDSSVNMTSKVLLYLRMFLQLSYICRYTTMLKVMRACQCQVPV